MTGFASEALLRYAFFQAEGGIRDHCVTGVQTCALPILCADYDVRTGEDIALKTFAGFAPLFARTADPGQRDAQLRRLDSADFCGDPRLRWPLLPSPSPAEPAFQSRNYWRGPVWPVITWLLCQSLT